MDILTIKWSDLHYHSANCRFTGQLLLRRWAFGSCHTNGIWEGLKKAWRGQCIVLKHFPCVLETEALACVHGNQKRKQGDGQPWHRKLCYPHRSRGLQQRCVHRSWSGICNVKLHKHMRYHRRDTTFLPLYLNKMQKRFPHIGLTLFFKILTSTYTPLLSPASKHEAQNPIFSKDFLLICPETSKT